MKRFLLALFLVLVPVFAFAAAPAHTVTDESIPIDGTYQRKIITLTTTSDDATGATADYNLVGETFGVRGWYLYSVETKAQTAGTTAAWDLNVWNSAKTFDLAQNLTIDRHASNAEIAYLGTVGYPIMVDKFVISIANTGNAKKIMTKFTFVKN